MSPFTANIAANGGVPAAGHNGSKWLKPAENKFTQNAYTGFSMQVSANLHNFRFRESVLHTYSKLSNRSRRKYFTNFIFGGFFAIWPNCAGVLRSAQSFLIRWSPWEKPFLLFFACLCCFASFLALCTSYTSPQRTMVGTAHFCPKIKFYIFPVRHW